MADTVSCDNPDCSASIRLDDPDAENWISVGWRGYKPFDACTRSCAIAQLENAMAAVEADGLAAAQGVNDDDSR